MTVNSMSNYAPYPTFESPFWGFDGALAVESGANRNVDPTFLFDFYTHNSYTLHRLTTTCKAADRQTQSE